MSLLGIDIGTTGCKAAVFNLTGQCIASSYREYHTAHPLHNQCELNSVAIVNDVWSIIREVALKSVNDPIQALCVCSMGEAMVPVSSDRKILANSILMSDARGAEYITELTEKIDEKEWYGINPNIIGTNYSLPKLLWIRDNQPELYDNTFKFLLWGDLIIYLLGCDAVTSFSHANRTLLFDINLEKWSDKLLTIAGISIDKLPDPVASGTVVGIVNSQIADNLCLPAGVKVVVGGHDQCCNSLGAGIVEAGHAVCGIGTYECITPTYYGMPEKNAMLASGLNIEHHVLPDLYVSFLYNQGGLLLKWYRDTFAAADVKYIPDEINIYDVLVKEMPDELSKIFVFPYFEMTGPPNYVNDASGTIIGITPNTSRGEILKAIMECETFYFFDSINALGKMGYTISECVAAGGGAQSNAWLQIKSDIFGIPFVRPLITETGVLGAAILAGVATGLFINPKEATEIFVHYESVFEPNLVKHEQYKEKLYEYQNKFAGIKNYLKPYMTNY